MLSPSMWPGRLVAVMLAGALCLVASACSDKPSQKDCETLLDKVVDMEIAEGGTDKLSPAMKADLDKQRKEIKEYLGERFMKQCLDNTPLAVVKCGLGAKSKADYAACETK